MLAFLHDSEGVMSNKTQQSYEERILRVLIYIQNHLHKKLALDELAAVAEFSPYHFHRIFSAIVGETVKEHVRRLRLEQAARSLKVTDEPITNIAFQAGYETHESFSRAFKIMFHLSPSDFRKASRESGDSGDAKSLRHLDKLKQLGSGKGTSTDVRIEKRRDTRVAFVRKIGPYDQSIEERDAILDHIRRDADVVDNTMAIAMPLDDPSITPESKLRTDWCIPVEDTFQPAGHIGVQIIEGGEYAVMLHKGDCSTLEETIETLFGDWFPLSNRDVRSAPIFIQYDQRDDEQVSVNVPLKPISPY